MQRNHRIYLGLATATAALLMSGGAMAQTRCGASYEAKPGDTLYRITQQCRVTMSRIMDLNPGLGDPRDIAVGTDIRLAASASGGSDGDRDRDPRPQRGEYRVERGDTMYSIAQALGLSLYELIAQNSDIDPFDLEIGERIDVPGDDRPGASVHVRPARGAPGDSVTVTADNLRPRDWVTIGVGERASEWTPLETVRVARDGELTEAVRVPSWADPGDNLVFVVDTDRGMTFKSGVFDVTDTRRDGRDGRDDTLALEGRVREGAECYTLRTPDGDLWSMVSDDIDFTSGEYVEVEGARADASFCMRGVGTIDVGAIREVRPPRDAG